MRTWTKRAAVVAMVLGAFGAGGVVGGSLIAKAEQPAGEPAEKAQEEPAGEPEGKPAEEPKEEAKKPEKATREDLTADEKQTIDIFSESSPSVVFITRMMESRFSLNASEVQAGTGSGFVWDADGHVVTNFHVIQGASKARVTLSDRSTYEAEIIGTAPDKDIAVLKIAAPKTDLQPLDQGASGDLLVGQHVYAIGNPFGLDHTLSTGVISGLQREIKSVSGFPILGVIQTDAAINPGNSGGPLLDSHGRLIGINTAIYSPSGASAGIGFAVPVDTVKRVVPQLIKHGKIVRPGLGVEIADNVRGVQGVVIMNVVAGSGAEAAGLRSTERDESSGRIVLGDVIVAIEGTPVKDNSDLLKALDTRAVGDKVTLTLERNKKKVDVAVTLGALSN